MLQIIFAVALGACSLAYGQREPIHELDEIVVTAGRMPTAFSDLARSVTVIGYDDIQNAPVHSVQGVLEYAIGVDIRQRGPLGVQADVRIRGGTFEQVLILIDGVKASDPQTGHHNLNLPLTLDDIERIEILKGQGARLYGPNALDGVINIITRKGKEKRAHLNVTVGDYGLSEERVSLSYPLGVFGHRLSLSRRASTGYRENTDFDILVVSYGTSVRVDSGEGALYLGYVDKEFGANSFYSDDFPDQWEHIEAGFLHAVADLKVHRFSFSPRLYWRRHKDDFILDRERPQWYRNRHTTDVYGVEFQLTVPSKLGFATFGGEAGQEKIESTNLGNRSRTKGGFFFEYQLALGEKLTLVPGAFAYRYSGWGWEIWPGMDLGVQIAGRTRLYGSVGRSFRVPTYTELYYSSPANAGNPNTRSEEAWTYETGVSWAREILRGNLAVFRREGRDLIDWVRAERTDPWHVRNIAHVNTEGLEISVTFDPDRATGHLPLSRMHASYAFLDAHKRTEAFESKYVLDQLRHQFILNIEHNLFYSLKQGWKLRYEDRPAGESHFLLDTRISWQYRKMKLFIEATNLFDTTYRDVGSIPMPGRWIKAGLALLNPFERDAP